MCNNYYIRGYFKLANINGGLNSFKMNQCLEKKRAVSVYIVHEKKKRKHDIRKINNNEW